MVVTNLDLMWAKYNKNYTENLGCEYLINLGMIPLKSYTVI